MEIIDLSLQGTIMNQFVSELRNVNVQNDRMRFRRNLERVGEVMAYEISKRLSYAPKDITTPLGTASVLMPTDPIVVATVFRAGLPLHAGFLNYFDQADNAFVSAYRYYRDKECRQVDVRIDYIATPALNGRTLMLVDPMLATGESMELALEAFCTKGKPKHTHLAAVIASQQGVDHLKTVYGDRKDITLWCAAIDPELNDHSYIVPGLGDAGDLAFGGKL